MSCFSRSGVRAPLVSWQLIRSIIYQKWAALQFLCFVTQHSQHDVDCMINLLRSKAAGPDGKKIKSRVAMDQSPVVAAFGSLLYMQRLPSSNSNHSSYSNHSAESCLASLLPPRSTDSAASSQPARHVGGVQGVPEQPSGPQDDPLLGTRLQLGHHPRGT
jgi:hypothetical protein